MGKARVRVDRISWWGIKVTRGNMGTGKSCVYGGVYGTFGKG